MKTGRATPSGAPIVEGGSYGDHVSCQDLLIAGSGRDATVHVAAVPLGGDGADGAGRAPRTDSTTDIAASVTRTAAFDRDPTPDPARSRSGSGAAAGAVPADPMITATRTILETARRHADVSGGRVVGTLAPGVTFTKPASHRPSPSAARIAPAPPDNQLGTLVADSALAAAQSSKDPGSRRATVGFVNPGSMRQDSLDSDGDGRVTERETHTLLALRFRNATIDLTGAQLREVLEQQWHDGGMTLSCLGVSSNVDYDHQYVVNDDGTHEVVVINLTVDGHTVRDGDRITVAGNSFLLGGGDGYTAFRAGINYRDTGVGYADALDAYLRVNPDPGTYFG